MLSIEFPQGYLTSDYVVCGHRDKSRTPTDSPGAVLYEMMQNWPHYDKQ